MLVAPRPVIGEPCVGKVGDPGVDPDITGQVVQGIRLTFQFRDAPVAGQLASATDLLEARRWGLAMRLGQRLSGGVAAPLKASALDLRGGVLTLTLADGDGALYGEAVERRPKMLAASFAAQPAVLEG